MGKARKEIIGKENAKLLHYFALYSQKQNSAARFYNTLPFQMYKEIQTHAKRRVTDVLYTVKDHEIWQRKPQS